MKLFFASVMLVLAALISFQGCNTLKGMGQDIENAGEELDEEL